MNTPRVAYSGCLFAFDGTAHAQNISGMDKSFPTFYIVRRLVMLVNFKDLKNEAIFFRKEYTDVSPILSMVESHAAVSIYLDPNGVERVTGRFHNYEFTIEISKSEVKESLSVSIASDENTVNYY